jgi:hypothetical protein
MYSLTPALCTVSQAREKEGELLDTHYRRDFISCDNQLLNGEMFLQVLNLITSYSSVSGSDLQNRTGSWYKYWIGLRRMFSLSFFATFREKFSRKLSRKGRKWRWGFKFIGHCDFTNGSHLHWLSFKIKILVP